MKKFLVGKECNLPFPLADCIRNFDAVIITQSQQVIEWVSSGFYYMTGYTYGEAVNKKPSFLQGPETNEELKQKIKDILSQQKSVRETIINYKKYGRRYLCDILIEPVFNAEQKLRNFIAFEKEVY